MPKLIDLNGGKYKVEIRIFDNDGPVKEADLHLWELHVASVDIFNLKEELRIVKERLEIAETKIRDMDSYD